MYRYPFLRCPHDLCARLLLANGLGFEGCGFGAMGTAIGEAVFTTAMTGYPESLTDPSYRGQILVETHPMMGNYGVPSPSRRYAGIPLDYESDRVQVEGFVVAELPAPSHHASVMSLDEWLRKEKVPGIYRVDTRLLVRILREHGVLMAALAVFPCKEPVAWDELARLLRESRSYDERVLALEVSPRKPIIHDPPHGVKARVSMLDCGVKYGILRRLLERGISVTRYPCDTPADELLDGYEGVILSNGPGNPSLLKKQTEVAAQVATSGKPVLAICLGMQLLSIGLGAKAYKLPYGHRGINKPVVELGTGKCYITTHNHGYAIDPDSLEGTGLLPWFTQPDDGTLEGVKSKDGLILATQFHPEAGPGPWDTTWIFDEFLKLIQKTKDW
ncbi:MAG: glutamine-hydrolyzing carbamoyl-phosphate synthase small subunit [Pyrodictiaceae archaeon]